MTHCRLNYQFIQQELMHLANLEKIAEDYILVLFLEKFINQLSIIYNFTNLRWVRRGGGL